MFCHRENTLHDSPGWDERKEKHPAEFRYLAAGLHRDSVFTNTLAHMHFKWFRCFTFFPPQDVCNCVNSWQEIGRRHKGKSSINMRTIQKNSLQIYLSISLSMFLKYFDNKLMLHGQDGLCGYLRVFLAESSTNSEEMSSSTPTSFLAMQVQAPVSSQRTLLIRSSLPFAGRRKFFLKKCKKLDYSSH